MLQPFRLRWVGLLLLPTLACSLAQQPAPQPVAEIEQLSFEVQTATPTVSAFANLPTVTPSPTLKPSPTLTATLQLTTTESITTSEAITAAEGGEAETTELPTVEPEPAADVAEPAPAPPPTPTVPLAEPMRGGVWSFEDGFAPWANPYGDACPGSGLAAGWTGFTSQDQFGSS
ncbi:MAG: hypothetical protein R3264_17970, partial [Anaerolineae bacterium]|nr:hypothetical protein [Anaerolineae bacterium]